VSPGGRRSVSRRGSRCGSFIADYNWRCPCVCVCARACRIMPGIMPGIRNTNGVSRHAAISSGFREARAISRDTRTAVLAAPSVRSITGSVIFPAGMATVTICFAYRMPSAITHAPIPEFQTGTLRTVAGSCMANDA